MRTSPRYARIPAIFVITAAMLATTFPVSAQDGATAPTFGDAWASVACEELGVAAELAPLADCGYVTVPENRATDSDRTIRLPVVRLRTEAAEPGTPMVNVVGGPGVDGLRTVSSLAQVGGYGPILAERDIVFFSQRGAKRSEPELQCEGLGNAGVEAAVNSWSDEQATAAKVAAMQACVDDYAAEGIDVSGYNTRQSARDVADIMAALGYDRFSLYGTSYGTQLSQFVMRQHPELLEAVILDGILFASAISEAEYTDYAHYFERVWAACAADETCSAAYPDPEGTLAQVYAALEAAPQPVEMVTLSNQTVPLLLDGLLAMKGLYTLGAVNYSLVPWAVYQLGDGNTSVVGRSIGLDLDPSSYNAGMHYAMICTDDPVTQLSDLGDEAAMYIAIDHADEQRFVDLCPILGADQLGEESDRLVESDIPTLLLQGGLDGNTAPRNGDIVATGLSTVYNVVFPHGAHTQTQDPCAVGIIGAFLADPMTAPDTSCISQEFAFGVPSTVTATSEDGAASFSFTIPPTVADLGNGTYGDNQSGAILIPSFSSETSPEAAIQAYIDGLSTVTVPAGAEIVDGDPVAGLPSKRLSVEADREGGGTLGMDVVAFGDDSGVYVLVMQSLLPGLSEILRSDLLPGVIESVTIGES